MCGTCGCSEGVELTMTDLQEGRSPIMIDGLQAHFHPHGHADSHEYSHHHHEHDYTHDAPTITSTTSKVVSFL